jgi:CTD small phosphatase-like protein 2
MSKVKASKYSQTPTNRASLEDQKKRPKTATVEKKSDTGSSPSLNAMITQVKRIGEDGGNSKSDVIYKEHLFQTFQAMKFVRSLQPVNLEQLKEKRANVPWKKGYEGRKTVIFDLDETLVHCCEDITSCKPDVILPVTFPTGEVVQAGINIRPYALECLREVNREFEVFVFTASHPCYANVVLDYLDPAKELIQQRFFRDSCMNVNGVYIKDLRIFANRNLKDMVIVDNAAYSFAYQLDNGIPIVSWHDDPNDKELFNLMDYVKALAAVDDIRDINDQTFHLRTFYEDYINEFLANDTAISPKQIKK